MNTQNALIGLSAAMLIFATPGLRAQPASGNYTGSFNGNVSLWDMSGEYSEDLGGLSLDYTLNMDSIGKFTGAGSVSMGDSYGDNFLEADLSFSGSIRSAGSAVSVTLALKMKGGGKTEGDDFTFGANATEHLTLDALNQQLTGRVTGSESLSIPAQHKHVSGPLRSAIRTDLPWGMDGTWRLALDVAPSGTKYTGTGSVTLSNARSLPVNVTGSYSGKTGLSKLTLKGAGINLSVTGVLQDGQVIIQKLSGKALGQTLRK